MNFCEKYKLKNKKILFYHFVVSVNLGVVRSTLKLDQTLALFYEDTSLIGIVSSLPGYKLCWLINRRFDYEFERDPDFTIEQPRKGNLLVFPLYHHEPACSGDSHHIYTLKSGKDSILPEIKEFDYLWMVKASDHEHLAKAIVTALKTLPGISLTHLMAPDQIKKLNALLV